MQDNKMTDSQNINNWNINDWKMTDKLAEVEYARLVIGGQSSWEWKMQDRDMTDQLV